MQDGSGIAAVIAFLLADPGQDLPRDLELSPDLLVDPQEARRDVTDRHRRGRVTDAAAGAGPADHDRQQRGAAGEQQRKRGRHDHEDPDAAPAGHDRHRRSPLLHAAHQPAAGPLLKREPQPIRRDPSVLDGRGRDDEPGRRSDRGQRHDPRVAAALGRRDLSALA